MQTITPYETKIQPEEMWLYRYPKMTSYIPNYVLYSTVLVVPLTTILLNYKKNSDNGDVREAMLAYSLAMCLTCVITMFLKIISGRLRPDFLWRCFPAGIFRLNTGRAEIILTQNLCFKYFICLI